MSYIYITTLSDLNSMRCDANISKSLYIYRHVQNEKEIVTNLQKLPIRSSLNQPSTELQKCTGHML